MKRRNFVIGATSLGAALSLPLGKKAKLFAVSLPADLSSLSASAFLLWCPGTGSLALF